jgi:multiple sugar transport system ATP-binding protein
MASLTLDRITKSFGQLEILHGIDLDIADGEFVVFVGPSGCGKSTLMRVIAGLEPATGGMIAIDGEDVTHHSAAARGLAMVFQSYALYPHMSVYDNLSFGLENMRMPKDQIIQRVNTAASLLQIDTLLQRKPGQLSGGQRQRVAIGRAITRNPKIFLFDEPLSNLDAELRVQMRIELSKLHKDLEATMIYVTHDQVEAMTMADKIVVLNSGRIEQVGSPLELYHRPNNLFVATFIGSPKMNLMPGEVTDVANGLASVLLQGGATVAVDIHGKTLPKGKVTLGIRPEHIELVSAGAPNSLSGKVTLSEHLGGETMLYVETGALAQCVVKADGLARQKIGEAVTIALPSNVCHLFDADGRALVNGSLI